MTSSVIRLWPATYSTLTSPLASLRTTVKPENVPPATPIELPFPVTLSTEAPDGHPLSPYLQSVHRLFDLEPSHLAALGLRVTLGAKLGQFIPDPSFLPDFAAWDALTPDEARERNDATRSPLCVTNRSPGCQTYLDRKRELLYTNSVAFRTVRRLPHPKGTGMPKLGGSYDFWRCLETLTAFWDDPTEPSGGPPASVDAASVDANGHKDDPLTSTSNPAEEDGGLWRSSNGENVPPNCLQNLASAFVKLVAYEFGCNVQQARVEPRLTIVSKPSPPGLPRRASSIPSNCTFIFRSATTRANARAGIIDGPLAAMSVRQGVSFRTELDSTIDVAREVVAALLTAQQRAREGKTEKRPGEGEWWTTKPRWGGGPGGPIGREMDKYDIAGDKDDAPSADGKEPQKPNRPQQQPPGHRSSTKARKTMSIYDNYRMIRPPSTSWDPKTRYEAIGRIKGAGHDDIFVISALVHHVSILRFSVSDKLLDVLAGDISDEGPDTWGGLPAWRSPWFDLFVAGDRIQAFQMLWSIMAYLMRKKDVDAGGAGDKKDADMAGA